MLRLGLVLGGVEGIAVSSLWAGTDKGETKKNRLNTRLETILDRIRSPKGVVFKDHIVRPNRFVKNHIIRPSRFENIIVGPNRFLSRICCVPKSAPRLCLSFDLSCPGLSLSSLYLLFSSLVLSWGSRGDMNKDKPYRYATKIRKKICHKDRQ